MQLDDTEAGHLPHLAITGQQDRGPVTVTVAERAGKVRTLPVTLAVDVADAGQVEAEQFGTGVLQRAQAQLANRINRKQRRALSDDIPVVFQDAYTSLNPAMPGFSLARRRTSARVAAWTGGRPGRRRG